MRSKIFCVLLGMAMGWTVTGHAGNAPFPRPSVGQATEPPPPYTERRWIGLRQKGLSACPKVDGWRADSLLDLALSKADEGTKEIVPYGKPIQPSPEGRGRPRSVKEGSEDRDLIRKYDLDRLCIYTAEDPSKQFPAGHLPLGLAKAERDRMAIASSGVPTLGILGDRTWQTLADHFVDQVGKARLVRVAKPSVRLVFVDTQPTSEQLPANSPAPNSWHGYTMAHYAQELICSNDYEPQGCAVHIATRLALPYDHFDPNMPFSPDPVSKNGGQFGRISDLAIAILAEIKQWQEIEPDTKLILNLSVGWDGELHGPNGAADLDARKVSELEPSVQAVYSALSYAAHKGVLVIAAAGNRRGGLQESQWPLLPAAWELRQPSWLPFPLCKTVYAVGGIDWQGLPLPNSRSGGRPRRAIYGDHAVVRTDPLTFTPESTMIYTGSSVSTAVASSIAAVVWNLRPHLGPTQVMRLISRSGEVLKSRADFYAWNWKPLSYFIKAPHLERLSLCGAVLRICRPGERQCPSLEAIDCELFGHPAADLSLLQPIPVTTPSFHQVDSPPPCDPNAQAYGDTSTSQNLCPMESYPDMSIPDAVNPQPPENPCPSCNIVPDPPHSVSAMASTKPQAYAINLEISTEWHNKHSHDQISTASLIIDCNDGSPIIHDISKDFPVYPSTGRTELGTIGDRVSLAGCTASVDFTINLRSIEMRSVQSPVYVDP
jgi:hypothetical protein